MERKVICIVGPTCSGKTEIGIELSKKLKGEIISGDSRQFYKFLDIGTAKPTVEQSNKVPHHLIDFLSPNETFNASQFENKALQIIEELFSKNKQPIVVGGSGLYLKALVDGITESVSTDEEYREKLLEERRKYGDNYLYERLKEVDTKSAEDMLPQNWKRVMRALEVYYLTGKPIWAHHEEYKREIGLEFSQYGLNWDREVLYKRIENRVDSMISSGLIDEVENILKMGYGPDLNSFNTVGYKEVIQYLNGSYSFEKMIELIKRNTRRFAKRQLTWFNKDKRIKWFMAKNEKDFDIIVKKITEDQPKII